MNKQLTSVKSSIFTDRSSTLYLLFSSSCSSSPIARKQNREEKGKASTLNARWNETNHAHTHRGNTLIYLCPQISSCFTKKIIMQLHIVNVAAVDWPFASRFFPHRIFQFHVQMFMLLLHVPVTWLVYHFDVAWPISANFPA